MLLTALNTAKTNDRKALWAIDIVKYPRKGFANPEPGAANNDDRTKRYLKKKESVRRVRFPDSKKLMIECFFALAFSFTDTFFPSALEILVGVEMSRTN